MKLLSTLGCIAICLRSTLALATEETCGTVKWYNSEKGFGFITPDNDGNDVFVHYSGVKEDGFKVLGEGQHVCYQLQNGLKGPSATDVHPAPKEE
ncbi:Cold shock-like protein CspE [Penicillium cosmopolitanum]|uniref:Cold shock-like protein CspE n=1 Tax=Penicillium cosmopolitanum TaxID=1131564 RepID=A0A9W9SKX2_9EURO|nr:Cold shock-like protein CspE [Penicillium cosmopolitanum]XP_057128525.1 Cold shock-like protein CspE [Penicillium waksmanii]KAJ5379604.1 Cold shock-like protein CspE [Penicillium cosmopolitanum]KAJ6001065.1 Cold shock-like protein CspE [Penicillium waksmanii]